MDTGSSGKLREHVAAELRSQLARKRISASEFARRVGWSQPYMARRYDGRVAMDLDDLEVIAREMGVSVAELLGGDSAQTTGPSLRPAKVPSPRPERPTSDRPPNNRPSGRPARTAPSPHTRRPVRL